jgi:serine/threonine-protein kinase
VEHQVAADFAAHFPELPGYRIAGEIAAGGMAVLYHGIQESLRRPVAIKALRTDFTAQPGEPDWVDRFVREAHLLASLQHENLVHVYDLIDRRGPKGQGGSLFIVMELCQGVDLLAVLMRVPVFPPDIASLIALYTAQALSHIHAHGILHRDLKPANLLLTGAGGLKLVDFGTAWDPRNPKDLLGIDVGLGTPSYMSPEQALGKPLSPWSDQFALGTVLYQLLTGRKPFVAPSSDPDRPADPDGAGGKTSEYEQVLAEVVRAEPTPLRRLNPEIPKELAAVVDRCLRRRAEERFAGTEELVEALEELVRRWLPRRTGRRARLLQFMNA